MPLLTAEPWLSLSRSPFASDNKPNSCPQLNIFSCTTYVHFWSLDYFFLQSPSVLLPLRYFSYHGNDNIIWMGGASCSVKLVSYIKWLERYRDGWQKYSILCDSFSCFKCATERYLCALVRAGGTTCLFQEGACVSFLLCRMKSFTWVFHAWFLITFSCKLAFFMRRTYCKTLSESCDCQMGQARWRAGSLEMCIFCHRCHEED